MRKISKGWGTSEARRTYRVRRRASMIVGGAAIWIGGCGALPTGEPDVDAASQVKQPMGKKGRKKAVANVTGGTPTDPAHLPGGEQAASGSAPAVTTVGDAEHDLFSRIRAHDDLIKTDVVDILELYRRSKVAPTGPEQVTANERSAAWLEAVLRRFQLSDTDKRQVNVLLKLLNESQSPDDSRSAAFLERLGRTLETARQADHRILSLARNPADAASEGEAIRAYIEAFWKAYRNDAAASAGLEMSVASVAPKQQDDVPVSPFQFALQTCALFQSGSKQLALDRDLIYGDSPLVDSDWTLRAVGFGDSLHRDARFRFMSDQMVIQYKDIVTKLMQKLPSVKARRSGEPWRDRFDSETRVAMEDDADGGRSILIETKNKKGDPVLGCAHIADPKRQPIDWVRVLFDIREGSFEERLFLMKITPEGVIPIKTKGVWFTVEAAQANEAGSATLRVLALTGRDQAGRSLGFSFRTEIDDAPVVGGKLKEVHAAISELFREKSEDPGVHGWSNETTAAIFLPMETDEQAVVQAMDLMSAMERHGGAPVDDPSGSTDPTTISTHPISLGQSSFALDGSRFFTLICSLLGQTLAMIKPDSQMSAASAADDKAAGTSSLASKGAMTHHGKNQWRSVARSKRTSAATSVPFRTETHGQPETRHGRGGGASAGVEFSAVAGRESVTDSVAAAGANTTLPEDDVAGREFETDSVAAAAANTTLPPDGEEPPCDMKPWLGFVAKESRGRAPVVLGPAAPNPEATLSIMPRRSRWLNTLVFRATAGE